MYVGNCVGEGNVFIVSLYQRSKGLSRNMYIAEEWCRVYRAGRRELEREVTDKIRKSFHAPPFETRTKACTTSDAAQDLGGPVRIALLFNGRALFDTAV